MSVKSQLNWLERWKLRKAILDYGLNADVYDVITNTPMIPIERHDNQKQFGDVVVSVPQSIIERLKHGDRD